MKILLIFSILFVFQGFSQGNNSSQEIDSLNQLGEKYYYTQKDSALTYFEEVYSISKKSKNRENLIKSLFDIIGVTSYHHDIKKLKLAIQELHELLGSYNDFDHYVSDENINILSYYTGIYQLQIFDEKRSIKTFKGIVENIDRVPDSLQTNTLKSIRSGSYSFLGKIYLKEGKYDLAKDLYNNAIRSIEETNPSNLEVLYGNYNLLAEVYIKQNRHALSNKYLLKTFDFNKEKQNTNTVISSGFYLSENYTNLKKQDSAFYYLQEAKSQFNDNSVFFTKYHLTKSAIHESLKDYDTALKELQIALKDIQDRFEKEKNIEVVMLYNKMGEIQRVLNNIEEALSYYDIALQELDKNFKNHVKIVKISRNKAKLLNSTKIKTNYQNAIKVVDKALMTLETLKPTFKSHEDKLVLVEDAFPLFESGMEAAYQLYKSSNNENYIDQAFNYSEKSKSVLLLEALLGVKANQFANIPDDLLERELQLKSEITFIEKEINQAIEADNEKEDQLFNLQEEHRQFITKIETDYKDYYNLKYNNQAISLSETQKLLKTDEKLISYFYGNEAIYAIGLDKESKQIERIPIAVSLIAEIKDVHKMLGDSKSDISILATTSHNLYERLVAPFVTSEKQWKLILFTDGLLNYIPFGALNTQEKGLSYLMENHAISYANSATLYAQLKERTKKEGELLAFAPEFSGEQVQIDPNRSNLLPLPHNKREVEQILNSFRGQAYINENASLLNFTSQLSNYGMLHLATHAVFDDTAPEFSYLAFSSTENQENLLYVSDLYNLQIDADLVTLSACESGVGELKRGEGFLSLARGFFYSGASSIASTLWKINDASTTTLMDSFYKNLSEGNAKGVALQKAKINFLESNRQNGLSHPYYWSGFIISGNTEPLTSPNHWIWISLGTLLAIVGGFFLFRKKIS